MFNRRELLGCCSVLVLLRTTPACAIVPAIAAALATITLIATATAKAADAIEKAIASGVNIWKKISEVGKSMRAAKDLEKEKERLANEVGIRREVIRSARTSQMFNAEFISRAYQYALAPEPNSWRQVRDSIMKASEGLGAALISMRTNAFWFPVEAQDALATLPTLYELRRRILSELMSLPDNGPPADDVRRLADGYDTLRVQSLKLLKALDAYTKPT